MKLSPELPLRFLVLVVVVVALPAAAQLQTGEIFGRVTDESGAVVAGATVTLESAALIRPLSVSSEKNGAYRFPSLPIGTYTVRFEMAGFATLIRDGIKIETGFNAEINPRLKLSAVQETLTVSGEAPVVDTRSTAIMANYNKELLEAIPSARDPWVILEQTPGMVMDRQN